MIKKEERYKISSQQQQQLKVKTIQIEDERKRVATTTLGRITHLNEKKQRFNRNESFQS